MGDMMMRAWPLLSRLGAALGQRKSMEALCDTRTVICPEETSRMPPVAMLPEEKSRVLKVQSETTPDHEWARVEGYTATHGATVRYEFSDVLATPYGFFVGWHGLKQFGRPPLKQLFRAEIQKCPKGLYCSPPSAIKYFGHWLNAAVPTALLAQEDEALYLPANPGWNHASSYLDLLDLHPLQHDFVHFETMSFCVDISQNSNRRARYREIQRRLRRHFKPGPERVYLSRGDTGVSRKLVNEAELQSVLKRAGFRIVSTRDDLETILAACAGAKLTVTMEGSHFAHAMFMAADDAFHVLINPADRFNNVYADRVPAFGSRLGTVVARPVGDGYHVDIENLLKLIDQQDPSFHTQDAQGPSPARAPTGSTARSE